MARRLTTTSYSVLGLLAIQPWSAYELTKQVDRSLRFCWPRAETRVYAEPKNLEEHGLVVSTTESHGRRDRTVYSITPAGREALRQWLEEPSSSSRLESEALLRLFFAEHGSKDALLRTLAGFRADAEREIDQVLSQAGEHLDENSPFPARAHLLALMGELVLEQRRLMARWAEWAEQEVAAWPDTASAPPSAAVIARFEAELAQVRASQTGPE